MGVSSSGTVAALQRELARWLSGGLNQTVEQVRQSSNFRCLVLGRNCSVVPILQGLDLQEDPSSDLNDR